MAPPKAMRKVRRELAAARDALAAAARKENKKKPTRGRRVRVSNQAYTRPLRQGTAAITTKPFGSSGVSPLALDANHPSHLPLPRAIGPYTVVRTTQLIKTSAKVNLFGPFTDFNTSQRFGKRWTPICCLRDVTAGLPINDATGSGNAEFIPFANLRNDKGWDNCSLTPAAFTIQVMNPKNLQSADGVARICRLRFMPDLRGDTRTWEAFGEDCAAFNYPRLCSGGKLALRGVKVDAMPFDMAELAEFTSLSNYTDSITLEYNDSLSLEPSGFAPIMVLLDDAMIVAGGLDILVTCEWRVRFDPTNPAQGTHQRYPVASDATWNTFMARMEKKAHGVEDIAETVAEYGAAAAGAVAVMG